MEPLKVRITNIDWSLVRAGTLDNTRFTRCPVIRIFGMSSTGDKACIHIHQVYPYFYVPYDGSMVPEDGERGMAETLGDRTQSSDCLMLQLGATSARSHKH